MLAPGSRHHLSLEHAYVPGASDARAAAFVELYIPARAHERLGRPTSVGLYLGRSETILRDRARIERQAFTDRCLRRDARAVEPPTQVNQSLRS